jgi:hypothetical protein
MLESKFSKRNIAIKTNSEHIQKERKERLVRNNANKYSIKNVGKKKQKYRKMSIYQ